MRHILQHLVSTPAGYSAHSLQNLARRPLQSASRDLSSAQWLGLSQQAGPLGPQDVRTYREYWL